jgi:phage shock protein A
MTFFTRMRRLLSMATMADADALLERMLDESSLHLAEARGEIQLCAAQETRLAAHRDEELRRTESALHDARLALAAGRAAMARQAAGRHVRARQLAGVYDAQLAQLQDSRGRLEALAETMAMKLAVLEHQQQVLQARRQLAQARQSLARGLRQGEAGQLDQFEERWLTDELAAEAYQELVQDELHGEVGDPVERILEGLREELPTLPETFGDEVKR